MLVGTHLKTLLTTLGYTERKGCQCKKYVGLMNKHGLQWCKENKPVVLSWLVLSAQQRKLKFPHKIAYELIEKAINMAEQELKNYFEEVYVVSLKRRGDRLTKFYDNLKNWPFKTPIPFEAIDGKLAKHPEQWNSGSGAWGCYRSHLHLIESCLNRGVKNVLLLEDDAICVEGFNEKVESFLKAVPKSWGMLYLGGQHLYMNKFPPKKLNEWVLQPYNINRTHAFALQGHTMLKVYQHLCSNDWKKGHHIDHHLGRLHEKRELPIFSPKEWLIGQVENYSNIAGRQKTTTFWQAPLSNLEVDCDSLPFVAVVGTHSSGSSCLAGVLYHLGIHFGNKLVGYYGNNPDKACGFEAQGLMDICEKAIPFPATELKIPKQQLFNKLKSWIDTRKREAHTMGTIAGGKYPMFCQMGAQLCNIGRSKLKLVMIDRPLEDSITSLVKRTNKFSPKEIEAHQRWLDEGKEILWEAVPEAQKIRIVYYDLLENPQIKIAKLIGFLELRTTKAQIEKAIAWVKPEERHV